MVVVQHYHSEWRSVIWETLNFSFKTGPPSKASNRGCIDEQGRKEEPLLYQKMSLELAVLSVQETDAIQNALEDSHTS